MSIFYEIEFAKYILPLSEVLTVIPQEIRSHIRWKIQLEIFWGTLVSKTQTEKKLTDLV